MITLNIHDPMKDNNANFRYVTAVMIEARIRGYPLLEKCPESLSDAGSFWEFINKLIDWLVENFPSEFEK
jgi:hypothetical protein